MALLSIPKFDYNMYFVYTNFDQYVRDVYRRLLGKENGCWGRGMGRLKDASYEAVCGPEGRGRGVFKSLDRVGVI